MVHDGQSLMIDELPVLRLRGLLRSDAGDLADSVGADATILSDEPLPIGGYGDVGTRTVAVKVTARALRAIARYLASQHSLAETVSVAVEIDDSNGSRHKETLMYKPAAGQGAVEAAEAALRALPGISDALQRSLW